MHEDKTTTEIYVKQWWRQTAQPNYVVMGAVMGDKFASGVTVSRDDNNRHKAANLVKDGYRGELPRVGAHDNSRAKRRETIAKRRYFLVSQAS